MCNRMDFGRACLRPLLLLLCLSSLLLPGCVTTTTGFVHKTDPKRNLESNIQLGIGYIRNGQYDRAKEKLGKALEVDSNSAEAYNAFGLLFQVQGEFVLAERNFKKALRLDPEFTQARNNYGAFLFSLERYDESIRQLEKASENSLYHARSQVFENLGICYLKTDQLEKAEQTLQRAVSLNPRQPRALLELSEIQFDRRNYVNAARDYQRYIKVAKQNARSLWLGIRLARIFGTENDEASYSMMLKNIFPASEEYKKYVATMP